MPSEDASGAAVYQKLGLVVRAMGLVIVAWSFYWMWTVPLDFGDIPLGPMALAGLGFGMMEYEFALFLLGRRGWPYDD